MEAAELALFMLSACLFSVMLNHPASPAHRAIETALARRVLTGIAMGATAVAIIYSPIGRRSGAHFNPAVTLTFWMLGKVETRDAIFYMAAQFAGGMLGVVAAEALIGPAVRHASVNYVVTVPGPFGAATAFAAEVAISFVLMATVLVASNGGAARYTGVFCGLLVAAFIAVEAPLSGMSMNPARTLGSAVPALHWTALWVYFTAPPLGMGLAAALYRLRRGSHRVFCAKLHHHNSQRCIFRCNWEQRSHA
jgi:aquaporin Z